LGKQIIYLEGRPRAHILHRRLAEALGCKIDFIDFRQRWQDKDRSFLLNIYSWFKNSYYINRKYPEADIFLIDNLHFTPVIMKFLFLKQSKKIVAHLGSHTLYFIYAKKFSFINRWLHREMLKRYDALICEGKMAEKMVRALLGNQSPPTFVSFLGPPQERFPSLMALTPGLEANVIIIVANVGSPFRMYYKGIDVMASAFAKAFKSNNDLKLDIIGDWSPACRSSVLKNLNSDVVANIRFVGHVSSLEEYLPTASLCLHCARGDAFPTSTLETLAAGLPTLVSEWTGTKEVIAQIDPELVIPLDADRISESILAYFAKSKSERQRISERGRMVVQQYTEKRAIQHYRHIFEKIVSEFG
jgi:glycosyltransferase involved in cell wall biosynthesis